MRRRSTATTSRGYHGADDAGAASWTPTTSSPQYTAPLSLFSNTTLRFIGIDNVGNESAVRAEVYIINTPPP